MQLFSGIVQSDMIYPLHVAISCGTLNCPRRKAKIAKMVRTIAIASGRGGLENPQFQLIVLFYFKARLKVALLDADFGMANCHIMLDQKVDNSLHDVLRTERQSKISYETASGVKLIPGSGILNCLT